MGLTPHLELYQPVPLEQGYGEHLNDNLNIIDTAIYDLQQAVDPNSYVPTGCQIIGADFTPPAGWLLCNGSAVSRSTYAPLFAKIGTRYGVGDGSTTFNLPNKVGKVVVGADPTGTDTDYLLGATGGVDEVTLTSNQIPAHKHNVALTAAPDHTHTFTAAQMTSYFLNSGSGGQLAQQQSGTTGAAGGHNHAVSEDTIGGGLAHENRMPYIAEPWWIKT